MYEQYHPLGVVGIISAFNFPVAVWSWNTALAWICGDVCVWKPSEKTPLCSIACQNIIAEVIQEIADNDELAKDWPHICNPVREAFAHRQTGDGPADLDMQHGVVGVGPG
jgi:hypothetical protein